MRHLGKDIRRKHLIAGHERQGKKKGEHRNESRRPLHMNLRGLFA